MIRADFKKSYRRWRIRQVLKLVFMLFIRVFALTIFFSSIAKHDTYYMGMAIWVWLMGNTIEEGLGIKKK